MSRPSKASKARKRKEKEFHRVHLQRYSIVIESSDAARVVCLKCGLEQAYSYSGSSDDPGYSPCPRCQNSLCETLEAHLEEKGEKIHATA